MLKNYYVRGNTSDGLVNHLQSNLHGIQETIRLEDTSYKLNTEILNALIEANKEETSVEVLKSPISKDYLDGVIFRGKQIAVLAHHDEPFTNKAYEYFQKGLAVHDDLEKVYIQEMDFEKADALAKNFIQNLLSDKPKQSRTPYVYHRLFGTNTVDGIVNEVPNLIADLDYIYHIKGRAGTGKSTFMKKVANACVDHGLDVEIYHCSFDPNSIDMVLMPELRICLFDSTDPHEFEPADKTREEIIDLYEEAVTPGTDEKYAKEIAELNQEYKSYMKKGLEVLKDEGKKILAAENGRNFSQIEIDQIVSQIQTKMN
ncbi:hypothetical protein M3210_08225 [Oceanobacillus luteolus]|uniref:Nucleotide kinase n=1 Tax=Oceanobacillus luteolus TaxID=1274358 RepID=A0ABW4HQB7_9BACI|nr:hypothetical protein [Oceanobacillus luteolus]MCM3740254.1 hypothetical protein [Oceanobacillus luteolus]